MRAVLPLLAAIINAYQANKSITSFSDEKIPVFSWGGILFIL
jgi:hypothetical protein